jgi:cerevisin
MAYRNSSTNANVTIFPYQSTTGAGFERYVIDSGIFTGHNNFGGRASWSELTEAFEGIKADDNDHGTHFAIIVTGIPLRRGESGQRQRGQGGLRE